MSFEELPHTADVRIRARAKDLDGIFMDLTKALMQVMYGKREMIIPANPVTREIQVSGEDTESLLRDYLSEVLFLTEVDGIVFFDAAVQVKKNSAHVKLFGEPFDPKLHSGGTEVKGISYSGLKIVQEANGYMAEIVFDV